ncbi:MAG: GTPase RsgA, partial [Acidobacteriota bacterium]
MSTHDDGFHPSKSDRTHSDRISSDPSILDAFGWSPDLAEAFEHHLQTHPHPVPRPARVISASREVYRVQTPSGERPARASGRLRAAGELPAIGDWVAVDGDDGEARIHAVLPRRTRLSRKVAGGRTEEQVVAANVDVVFLVMGLDGDFNLRRLERFAVMAWASGAEPVVLLTKADLADDVPRRLHQAGAAAPGMPVYAVSALAGEGLDAVRAHLAPGRTVALIGSSGVGKSTLVNRLCGEEVMLTSAVRVGDDRGRHTTTHRQLMRLPGGGLLIDTPGVREIQLWVDGDDADADGGGE